MSVSKPQKPAPRRPQKASRSQSKQLPKQPAKSQPKSQPKSQSKNEAAEKARTRLELDERRQQLIELGFDMFAKHAYDKVHIGELARKAGISKGLLYHYFPTKRDFYTATLRVAANQLLQEIEVEPCLPPLERLTFGLDHYLQFVERYATAYVALMRGGVGADPQVAAIIEETRGACFSRLMTGLGKADDDTATVLGLPALAQLPIMRTALRGFVGFVEATSLEWAVARDLPRQTLVSLLVQVLLQTLQTVSAQVGST